MQYVEVIVADSSYHGLEPLTYASESPLLEGAIVVVPLRQKLVLGIVVRAVAKPRFTAKPVAQIADLPPASPHIIKLIFWLRDFYVCSLGAAAQQCLPRELPKKPVEPLVVSTTTLPELPPLTADQTQALAQFEPTGMHLLHGETGTGKTRIYIELARASLAAGKSAIILTPEIGLTSQLEQNFQAAFGERVLVVHSQLTSVTRQRQWVALLKTDQPMIVLGPRSALFVPLRNLGLIVVDESHETAYKQDSAPYYHASRVASKLAELHKAPVVLGSATPLVTDYFLAEHRHRPIIRMTQTATTTLAKSGPATNGKTTHEQEPTQLSVVDLRDHDKFSKTNYFSDELIKAMRENLGRGEQTLLFLNRRGTARTVFCENCGWQATCPNCDLPLVYHGDTHKMRCHSCEFSAPSPVGCPKCRNASIVFKSIGTKAVADEVARLFPSSKVQRFDTDNTKDERIENHYDAVRAGDIDIIIGTQTLAKGLDLPKLSLVGVLIADTSLFFPDFSAQERTYQLLSQVVGRVGRGHRAGRAIIQTYNPDSALLKAILAKDWQSFYTNELSERQTFMFPPFCYVLKLTCRRASQNATIKAAEKYMQELQQSGQHIRVEGPAPAFHEKIAGKFEWQLVVKSKNRATLLDIVRSLPSGWSYDIDPMNLL